LISGAVHLTMRGFWWCTLNKEKVILLKKMMCLFLHP
jgi:hypothetical protein